MNKVLAAALAASLALSASSAFAGGPVIVAEEPVVAEEAASSGGILPLVLVGIALCVALCGGSSDDSRRVQDPVVLPAGN